MKELENVARTFGVEVAADGGRPTSDECMVAAIAYASGFIGFWYVGPLAIYLWQRERSRFVAFHAVQALALQLLLTLAWICFGVLLIAGVFGGGVARALGNEALGYAIMTIAGLCWLAMLLVPLVWSVQGALRAWHGSRTGAPIVGRLASRVIDDAHPTEAVQR